MCVCIHKHSITTNMKNVYIYLLHIEKYESNIQKCKQWLSLGDGYRMVLISLTLSCSSLNFLKLAHIIST